MLEKLVIASLAGLLFSNSAWATPINVAEDASVTLNGTYGVLRPGSGWDSSLAVADPATLVDGNFFPISTLWNGGSVWWDQTAEGSTNNNIVIDLGDVFELVGFIVQADDNDAYLIEYWDGANWIGAWTIPIVGGWGSQTRPNVVNNDEIHYLATPISTDRLRFTGVGGDSYYSVTEIQAYAFAFDLSVEIDIEPHSATNRIDLDSDRDIWVAVMSSTATVFDPLQIDIDSVRFGPDGAEPYRYHVHDFNGDGLGDLVLRFDIGVTGISCLDTHASISGVTFFGESFSGTDFVTPRRDNCGQREVLIDIKPLSSRNWVYPGFDKNLYVAVLSNKATWYEPLRIDMPTVRFGPGNAEASGSHTKDVNGDGFDDLVLRFSNVATRIECGDTEATLTGSALNGENITGSDLVRTRGCL